jgi:hypothetical protein
MGTTGSISREIYKGNLPYLLTCCESENQLQVIILHSREWSPWAQFFPLVQGTFNGSQIESFWLEKLSCT